MGLKMKINREDLLISDWSHESKGSWSLRPKRGVMIVHLPTGTVVKEDSDKSQYRNKEIAMKRLRDILSKSEAVK